MNPIEVPSSSLNPEILEKVISHFILREGTDYGAHEVPLETKTKQVRKQIESGKIKIIFDPTDESINLLPTDVWKKSQASLNPSIST